MFTYTTFTPTVFSQMRTQIHRFTNVPTNFLLAVDIWEDITSDPDFVSWFEPVMRHELIFEGKLGSMLGMNILTDGFREQTLSVLQPGETYIFGPPITVGVITDRQGLQSRPIDTYNQGRAAQGWFLHQIQGTAMLGRGIVRGTRTT